MARNSKPAATQSDTKVEEQAAAGTPARVESDAPPADAGAGPAPEKSETARNDVTDEVTEVQPAEAERVVTVETAPVNPGNAPPSNTQQNLPQDAANAVAPIKNSNEIEEEARRLAAERADDVKVALARQAATNMIVATPGTEVSIQQEDGEVRVETIGYEAPEGKPVDLGNGITQTDRK